MIKKYCKHGLPLYIALISAALYAHAIALERDAKAEDAQQQARPTLTRHA